MGFFSDFKANSMGHKAYAVHCAAIQLRKTGRYAESETKLDQAILMYEQAYQMGYRKNNVIQGYALLLMRKGNFERAREIMLECSKDKNITKDERFTLRMDFAVCQWKMGQLDKAIETARRAAEMKMNGHVYNTLGMFLVEKACQTGDFEEAIAFNAEALDYDDEDAGVLDNMGQMNLGLSRKAAEEGKQAKAAEYRKEAYKYFEKAWKTKPEQISSTYYYAKLLHEDGNDEKAREVLKPARKVPFSAMLQITQEQAEALVKEIGE